MTGEPVRVQERGANSAMDAMQWSEAYRPEWDATPEAYVDAGAVGWGRSRRLGRYVDGRLPVKAYVGVQHDDPARWGVAGEPQAKFFASLFLNGRTVTLRTFPTMGAALAAFEAFRAQVARELGDRAE